MSTLLISRPSLSLGDENPFLFEQSSIQSSALTQSLTIIDSQVQDLQTLRADISSRSAVFVLDAEQDGIQQITEILAQHPHIKQLHLVSHGFSGSLNLGNSRLELDAIDHYKEHLKTWSSILQDCDLFLYGCQVASGVTGALFLQQLHLLTGANIAASKYSIGRNNDQSYWELETQVGTINNTIIFSPDLQVQYQGSFETANVTLSFSVTNNAPSTDPTEIIEENGVPLGPPGTPPPAFDPATQSALVITFNLEGFMPGQIPIVRIDTSQFQGLTRFFLPGQVPFGVAAAIVPVGPDAPLNSAADIQIFFDGATLTLPIFSSSGVGPNPADIPGMTETEAFTFTNQGLLGGIPLDFTINSETEFVEDFTFFETEADFLAAQNSAPIAVDDAFMTFEDIALSGNVLDDNGSGADIDPDVGDTLTVTLDTNVSSGTLNLNADGSFDYTPNANFNGTDSFIYTLTDAAGEIETATATITVTPVNDAPVADDDSFSIAEDNTLTVAASDGVLANDSDVDGDSLTATLLTDVSNGTLTLNTDGSFDYTPSADFNGTDSFTYEISDGNGGTDTATATITVNAINDAPVAADDGFSVDEDQTLTVSATDGVLANDSDVDGDSLIATLLTDVSNGTLTLNTDGSFDYTPAAGFSGTDSFTYEVSDGNGGTATATAVISIGAVNDVPVAVDDGFSVDEDQTLTVSATDGVLANDSDVDGDSLTATLLTDVSDGTLTLNADGSFDYTPSADFNGTDSFTYEVSDGNGGTDTATATITVNAINDAPVAADDGFSVDEDQTLTVSAADGVLANDSDVDGDSLTATLLTDVSDGTLTLNADGSFDYTPSADFNGTDSFTYEVSDGDGGTDTATATITVNAINDAPVALDDCFCVDEDQTLTVSAADGVLANDFDVDGDNLTVSLLITVSNGTLSLNADGSFDYTPAAGFSGTDSFTYEVSDGNGGTAIATAVISIGAVNDAPIAVDDGFSVDEDQTLTVSVADGVLANDSDVDGDSLTATLLTDVSNGTLTLNTDGSFDYTPSADFNGTDSFTYEISDGNGGTDTATATITVNAINDAPVAADDGFSVDEDQTLTVSAADGVLANDSDVDGDSLTVSLLTDVSDGTLTLNTDGSFDYTPSADFNGTDSFTYEVSDGNGGTASATATITVNAVNDAPVALDDSFSTGFETTLTVPVATGVLDNDTDVDLDDLTAAVVAGPSNGSLTLNSDGSFDYTPDAGFSGTDSFTYTANDGALDSNIATATIEVGEAPPIPEITIAFSTTTLVEEPGNTQILTITHTASEPLPPGGVTLQLTSSETAGLLRFFLPEAVPSGLAPSISSDLTSLDVTLFTQVSSLSVPVFDAPADRDLDGDGTIDDVAAAPETVTFTATVVSGAATINPATTSFDVTFEEGNNAPVAEDDDASTDEDTAVSIPVLDNDSDIDVGDAISIAATTDASNGSIEVNSDGTITYTPDDDFNGTDSFTYTIADAAGLTDTATVNVTVNPINDAPVAVDDSDTTEADTAVTIDVLANDFDVDTDDVISVDTATDGANGTTIVNDDGTITYTPNPGFSGTDSFTYTISDLSGVTDTAIVTVEVEAGAADAGEPDIVGTEGKDRLYGDDDDNIIEALGGNDHVFALGGDDQVSGGDGKDLIFGGDGNDTLAGDDGRDFISGGRDDDEISGGAAADRLFGNSGDDLIFGDGGKDRIFGGSGKDRVSGGEESDRIFGNSGNDILSGDAGNDLIFGGSGDDLIMGVTGDDTLLGGFGADTFVFGNGDGEDRILDFRSNDLIGLVDGELAFADLDISQQGISTVVGVTGTGETLVTLLGVSASSLTEDRFVLVPDISDVANLPPGIDW